MDGTIETKVIPKERSQRGDSKKSKCLIPGNFNPALAGASVRPPSIDLGGGQKTPPLSHFRINVVERRDKRHTRPLNKANLKNTIF